MAESLHDREAALAIRESDVERREAELADRLEAAHEILAAAELRDIDADERDGASTQRDRLADRAAFLAPIDTPYETAGRRSAARDRQDSKDDRSSAADDRQALVEHPVPEPETDPAT